MTDLMGVSLRTYISIVSVEILMSVQYSTDVPSRACHYLIEYMYE